MLQASYPSMMSSSKGAGLSQTGQVHVGFFSFICRKKTASKHWRWAQVKTRHGTPSRIFTNWEIEKEKHTEVIKLYSRSVSIDNTILITMRISPPIREFRYYISIVESRNRISPKRIFTLKQHLKKRAVSTDLICNMFKCVKLRSSDLNWVKLFGQQRDNFIECRKGHMLRILATSEKILFRYKLIK